MERVADIPHELKNGELYAPDFKTLGVEYLGRLRTQLNTRNIIAPRPYPDNEFKKTLAQLHAEWEEHVNSSYHAPVYIKYCNTVVGFGVYATQLIKAYDTVGEYTGDLCVENDSMNDESLDYAIDVGNFYQSDQGSLMLYVNAKKGGNFTRFINHSYIPNVDAHSVYNKKDGLWHVLYRANQDIQPHSQLLTNYGSDYWDTRNVEPVDLTPDS